MKSTHISILRHLLQLFNENSLPFNADFLFTSKEHACPELAEWKEPQKNRNQPRMNEDFTSTSLF